MKIDQHDLDTFELCVRAMYDGLELGHSTDWFERRRDEPVTLQEATEAWRYNRMFLYYSPDIGIPAIPMEAMDHLAVLMCGKHVATQASPLTQQGREIALRALISDLFEAYGINDYSLLMVNIMSSIVLAPLKYQQVHKHYPVNDKALIIAYCRDQHAALSRCY